MYFSGVHIVLFIPCISYVSRMFYISTIFNVYCIFIHFVCLIYFNIFCFIYLFRTVCSRSWVLRVIIGQWKTCAHAIRWTLCSDCVRFDALVCTRSRYENTIVRKDFLPIGYRIGGCRFLITLLGSTEGGGDVIDIGCWNLIDLFSQNL